MPDTNARTALIETANRLRQCLSDINRYGDELSARLVAQGDGFAYGEVYDGFKILMVVLFPDEGLPQRAERIIDEMFNSDVDVETAAQYVADKNAPMWGHSTDDIRGELVKYRAWLRGLDDGVVDPVKIVGQSDNAAADAVTWLTGQIEECVAALAYRNEPEVTTHG